jgi:hypothetical protein
MHTNMNVNPFVKLMFVFMAVSFVYNYSIKRQFSGNSAATATLWVYNPNNQYPFCF